MSAMLRNLLLLLTGTALGASLSVLSFQQHPAPDLSGDQDLVLLHEVFDTIDTYYVDPLPRQQLVSAAINGIFTQLDAHSAFLNADAATNMLQSNRGEYFGYGFEFASELAPLTLRTVFPQSPAALAGLQSGDVLQSCNTVPITPKTLSDILAGIKQSAQMKQALALQIQRADAVFAVSLMPASIQLQSVNADVLAGNIGYLRISHFQQNTADDVQMWLQRWQDFPLEGLIIDLRNNPGGLFDQAVKIADMFLDQGIIVSTQGRYLNANEVFYASVGSWRTALPIVILINQQSASAAEILTGALKDHHRAIIIGEHSFGKGTVQSLIPNLYDQGSMLKLTTARYATPSGKVLDTQGIEPDIKVTQDIVSVSGKKPTAGVISLTHDDPQFTAAVTWLETHNH